MGSDAVDELAFTDCLLEKLFGRVVGGSLFLLFNRETISRSVAKAASTHREADFDCSVGMPA